MKVLKALQAVRAELSQTTLKKSGHNKFAGFDYFELSDFLPTIQQLCAKYNICPVFVAGREEATLTVYSCEDDSVIAFSVPAVRVEMKGANAIQMLGAEQTYLRRYCYMAAFEISESDAVDAVSGSAPVKDWKAEMERVCKEALERGMTQQELKDCAAVINPKPSSKWSDDDRKRLVQALG